MADMDPRQADGRDAWRRRVRGWRVARYTAVGISLLLLQQVHLAMHSAAPPAAPPSAPAPRRLQPLPPAPRSVASDAQGQRAGAGRSGGFEAQRADDAINSMSVAQLRGVISAAGLSFTDCVEKSELVERAREAAATGAGAAASLFTPAPEPAPARKPTRASDQRPSAPAAYVPTAPAPAPDAGRRSPNNSATRSLFGSDGVKVGTGAAPHSTRPPAPASPSGSARSADGAWAPPRPRNREHITRDFWREESGWKHAPLLNLVVHIRATVMLVAGVSGFVLAQQGTSHAHDARPSHCDTLRRWVVVGSVSLALAGALAPFIWRKLRAVKLERGVGSAKRLREKGFGSSRLSRSKDNTARHRGCMERLGGCFAFPVIVCFVGIQAVGFSAETAQCSASLQSGSTLLICSMYFVLCFQCVCVNSVQCSLWKEVDLTMVADEEADEEHERSIHRAVTPSGTADARGGQQVPEP